MKLAFAAATLPALLVSGYTMGGFNKFGRPVIITQGGPCGSPSSCGPSRKDVVDRAFDQLQSDLQGGDTFQSSRRGRAGRRRFVEDNVSSDKMSQAAMQQQQEWLNRALGLAQDVATGLTVGKGGSEDAKQQQEWLDRAFGVATDMSSGLASPRYTIEDGKEAFQVTMDVPGVKASAIDVSAVDEDGKGQVLTIEGQREITKDGVSRTIKFSKSFSLDAASVDLENISAQLNNGVLVVTAPKDLEKEAKKTLKIPVTISDEEDISVEKSSADDTEEKNPVNQKDDSEDTAGSDNGDPDASDS